jgi:hypothetical protein
VATRRASVFSAWLNGQFLGSSGSGQGRFSFPAGALRTGTDNVLSVLVENMAHDEDYNGSEHRATPTLTTTGHGRLRKVTDGKPFDIVSVLNGYRISGTGRPRASTASSARRP